MSEVRKTVDMQAAFEFDLQVVTSSYQYRTRLPPTRIALLERELRRFLLLVALEPEESVAVPAVLDGLWHELILHTNLYESFCNALCGRFIHHHPKAPWDRVRPGNPDARASVLKKYVALFGERPPTPIWGKIIDHQEC